MKFYKTALFAALVAVAYGSNAQAHCNGWGIGPYGYGYQAQFVQPYIPAPPYFALHPPVYYGQKYTRPYGLSPFAAWPELQASGSQPARPHAAEQCTTIVNPYWSGNSTPSADAKVAVAKPVLPLVIENPYFKPESVRLASHEE